MLGKTTLWFFTITAMIGVFSVGVSALFGRVQEQESEAAPLSHELQGRIVQVNSSPVQQKLLVETNEGDLFALFMPPQEVVVMQWGKVTDLKQLETGQTVKVRYKSQEGKAVAHLVEISDPKPMPAAAEKPATPWKESAPAAAIGG